MQFSTIAFPIIAALTAMQGTNAPIAAKTAIGGAKAAAKSVGKGLAGYGVTSGRVGTAVGIAGFGCGIGSGCGNKMTRAPSFIHVKKASLIGRDDRPAPPEGVNEHDWNNCIDGLDGINVDITGPVGDVYDGIEVRGLPSICMPLVSWFIGNPQDTDVIPITCDTDCVRYATLTEEDYDWVKEGFEALGALHCVDVVQGPDDKFCAYTAATSGPYGTSVVTVPEHAAHLAGFVVDTYQHVVLDPPYQVTEVPGKGRGIIATRAIKKDEPILSDYAILVVDTRAVLSLDNDQSDALLRLATDRLSKPHSVYEGARAHPEHNIVLNVVATNAFALEVENESYYRLFPEIALMNHDCTPNARPRFSPRNFGALVTATRNIMAGEEITITYLAPGVPFYERRSRMRNWGFTCNCHKCTAPRSDIRASDDRMRLIEKDLVTLNTLVDDGDTSKIITAASRLLVLSGREGMNEPKIMVYDILKKVYLGLGKIQKAKSYAEKSIHLMVDSGLLDERDERAAIASEWEMLEGLDEELERGLGIE